MLGEKFTKLILESAVLYLKLWQIIICGFDTLLRHGRISQ
jgi:hypothetical protein